MSSGRAVEMRKNVYPWFVDFQKTSDTVDHEQQMALLQRIGIVGKDQRLIVTLYWYQEQRAAVRVDKGKTGWMLLSDVLSLYKQTVMKISKEGGRYPR